MEFGKNHKVKISTLNGVEGKPYKLFLRLECVRHFIDMVIVGIILLFLAVPACLNNKFALTSFLLWFSAAKRHQEDIIDIDKLIAKVNKRFGWE